jgi:hypothetical protein
LSGFGAGKAAAGVADGGGQVGQRVDLRAVAGCAWLSGRPTAYSPASLRVRRRRLRLHRPYPRVERRVTSPARGRGGAATRARSRENAIACAERTNAFDRPASVPRQSRSGRQQVVRSNPHAAAPSSPAKSTAAAVARRATDRVSITKDLGVPDIRVGGSSSPLLSCHFLGAVRNRPGGACPDLDMS